MPKTLRLKSRRQSESKKLDLAIKYAERGVATGGGHISPKKLRRTIEARNIPIVRGKATAGETKARKGRHHPPPSRSDRRTARVTR